MSDKNFGVRRIEIGISSVTENQTVLQTTGKVGIGTTNAQGALHITEQNEEIVEDGERHVDLIVENPGVGNARIFLKTGTNNRDWEFFADDDDGSFGIHDGAVNRRVFSISTDSYIGIGTVFDPYTQPLQRLDVRGSAYISGDIGIGTTNPTKTLDVVGYGTSNGIRVGDIHFFAFENDSSQDKGSPTFQNLNANGNTILRVLPNGTGRAQCEVFATDYFANAGIGTTTWNNLRIFADNAQGEIRIDTSAATEAGVAKSISIETNVEAGGGNRPNQYQLYLDVNGNVGFGTNDPSTNLDIRGDSHISGKLGIGTTNPTKTLDVAGYGSSNGVRIGDFQLYTFDDDATYAGSISFGAPTLRSLNTSTTLFRILPGIGATTNKQSALTIFSNDIDPISGVGTTSWSNIGIFAVDDDDYVTISTGAEAFGTAKSISIETRVQKINLDDPSPVRYNPYQLYLDVNGNVGFGTNDPQDKLHIIGNAIIDGNLNITGVSTISQLNVGAGGTVITTTASGNVGINSTSPERKLDVVDSGASGSVIRSRVTTNNGGYLAYEALNSSGTSVFSVNHNGRINLSENIVFASGQGLDFSATSDGSGTTTSELLDDYEEGTWTPTLQNTCAATPSYQYQEGNYTKIGRYVIAQGIIGVTNSNTFGSGDIRVSLPFTASATGTYGFCGPVAGGSGFPTASFAQFGTIVGPGNSYGGFITIDTSALEISYNLPSATWYVRFNFMYLA